MLSVILATVSVVAVNVLSLYLADTFFRTARQKKAAAALECRFSGIETQLTGLKALPTAQEFNRVRSLAEGASMICEGMIPDSGIKAQSFDGAVVVTGMPTKG